MVEFSQDEFLTFTIIAAFRGSKKTRVALGVAGLLYICGISLIFLGKTNRLKITGAVMVGVGFLIQGFIYVVAKVREVQQEQAKIEQVEQKAQDNPQQPQYAWEAGRVKLESYLNRNLSQVRSIFFLTNIVMGAGFVLIGIGAYQAFQHPESFKASVLSAVSGVIVSFIGGTFLILYKATMAQAKDYVTILERINAVGMSIQILELLDEQDRELKHQTMADVAGQILQMYAGSISRVPSQPRPRAAKTIA